MKTNKARQITQRLQSHLKIEGTFSIPWQIAARSYSMSSSKAGQYEQLAKDCFAFLSAVAEVVAQPAGSQILSAVSLSTENIFMMECALKSSLPPLVMVRPDVIHGSDGKLSVVEMETMIGGLGMSIALHEAYQAKGYMGIPEAYAGMVKDVLKNWRFRSERRTERPVVGVIIPAQKQQYDWEFESLAQYLALHDITMMIGRPGDVRIDGSDVFLGQQRIDCMHRFFRLSELAEEPSVLATLRRINQKRYVPMLQPWIEVLEEKALMAFIHEPTFEELWKQKLGEPCFARLKHAVPPTYIVGLHPQLIKNLYTAPKTARNFWLKRSSNTWGGRQAYLGSALSNSKWQRVLEQSVIESLRGQAWILQENRTGASEPISCVVDGEIISMQNYVGRFNPFVCWSKDGPQLADFRLTARNNPKVHGASDATFLPISVMRNGSK